MSATNQTTNYQLPLFIGSDKPSWLGDFNGAMNKVDTALAIANDNAQNAVDKVDRVEGSLSTLQSSIEANTRMIGEVGGKVGTLEALTTVVKTSAVDAINEVQGEVETVTANVGALSELTTPDRDSIVGAVNNAYSKGVSVDTRVGNINNLTTDAKSSIVGAINEVNDKALGGGFALSTRSKLAPTAPPFAESTSYTHCVECAETSNGKAFQITGLIRIAKTGGSYTKLDQGIALNKTVPYSGEAFDVYAGTVLSKHPTTEIMSAEVFVFLHVSESGVLSLKFTANLNTLAPFATLNGAQIFININTGVISIN